MKDIIAIKYNLNTQRDYLKLKLEQKELVEYSNWRAKEENTTNREAMDKVVARLKLESESWMLEEADLIEIKNKATLAGNIYDVLVGYIGQGISREVVDKIANEYIEEFGLGEFL
jgi:uncharacterized protein YdaL